DIADDEAVERGVVAEPLQAGADLMGHRKARIDDEGVADRERATDRDRLAVANRIDRDRGVVQHDRPIDVTDLHADAPRADRRAAVEAKLDAPGWRHVAIDLDRFGSGDDVVRVRGARQRGEDREGLHPMIREPSSYTRAG